MSFRVFIAFLITIVISSCEVAKQSMVVPPYTSVDKLVNLKQGMTTGEVSKTLGIEPYDIYHIQEDGSSILVYNYRVKDRKAEIPSEYNKREEFFHGEGFQTAGVPYYKMESSKAYVLYKDGKMKSVITDEGKSMSEFIMLINGNLKLLSKEDLNALDIKKIDDKYIVSGQKDGIQTIIPVRNGDHHDQIIKPVLNDKSKNTKGCLVAGGIVGAIVVVTSLIVTLATY